MSEHYDGTKLLSLPDSMGLKPELYLCTTNRTGGKTTFFNRLLVRKYLKNQGKFMLLYRYNTELEGIAEAFFGDIQILFFQDHEMSEKRRQKGLYLELFMDGESCGYAVALNQAERLKKISHIFCDVNRMLFDEFQLESNRYLPDEVSKFLSLHKSVARGRGQMRRYVPVYMIGNTASLINPYYVKLGISTRLKKDTKFLRGNGFVLEQGYLKNAAKAQQIMGIDRAFAGEAYTIYSAQAVYLNDNISFITKPSGRTRYICTIKYCGNNFAVKEYLDEGIIYCDKNVDETYPIKIATAVNDHEINYVMMRRNSFTIMALRGLFEQGMFRFADLECKEALIKIISY